MHSLDDHETRTLRARERALRAVRAVTFTFAAVGLSACAAMVTSVPGDGAGANADALSRGQPDGARATDASFLADATSDRPTCADAAPGSQANLDCCTDAGWNAVGCIAWGPFMPPAAGA